MASDRIEWHGRGALAAVEIAIYPDDVGAAELETSQRELRQLVYAFVARDPDARRVALSVLACLGRLPGNRQAYDLDAGSPAACALGEELLQAARAGAIVARPRVTRSVIVPLDIPSEEVLGPDSASQAATDSKSWVGLVLVDQTGAPVPNRPYRIVLPDGTTLDGKLDSNGAAMIKEIDPGNCQIWCPYVEPHPETTYTVAAGDHISGIAQSFGFDDFNTVWSHPDNADLSQTRTDPHVLQPGDTLAIPELPATPTANKPTSAKHQFQISQSPLQLRLTLLGLDAKPVASAQVTVAGTSLTTDGNGLVEATVDKGARDATFDDPNGNEISLSLGGLNPPDDTSDAGYKARLYNMGFLWDSSAGDTDDEMVIALQDFQAQYSLPLSGQLDDATKAQLTQGYGA